VSGSRSNGVQQSIASEIPETTMQHSNNNISLLVGGDCGPVHGPKDGFPIERYTELVRPALATADMRFVNCMRTYSTRAAYNELAPQVGQPPEMAQIFSDCRFDAVNMANNHTYDSGPDALIDTRAFFNSKGIQVTGAGRDLAEARQPAIIERNGVKVGYLGYCSVGNPGSEAGLRKPGIAPLRVKTFYEVRGPHAPVRILTQPVASDLDRLVEDVKQLRKQVDIVMVALHYGVIRVPRVISDYQVTAAHACIDAGADIIVGHAPHIPKAIEIYKGKAIFYSLGVFCMTRTGSSVEWNEPPWSHGAVGNHAELDPEYPFMPYGTDCKRSLLAKAVVSKDGVKQISFLPMMIDTQYRPEILRNSDARFTDIVQYMEWVSKGFDHKFTVEGDEVVVTAS
jgi:poly-gamma-glutamate synthesis protein (capsule biosynthesis protein)